MTLTLAKIILKAITPLRENRVWLRETRHYPTMCQVVDMQLIVKIKYECIIRVYNLIKPYTSLQYHAAILDALTTWSYGAFIQCI